jgi:hypothetical protein
LLQLHLQLSNLLLEKSHIRLLLLRLLLLLLLLRRVLQEANMTIREEASTLSHLQTYAAV